MRTVTAIFASIGLALLLSSLFAFFAYSLGILFGGLDAFFAMLVTMVFCAYAIPITSVIYKRKGKHFAWRVFFIEIIILALVIGGSLSWLQTRQALKIFFNPCLLPSGLHVYHGRNILFSSFVHFTAPPAAI